MLLPLHLLSQILLQTTYRTALSHYVDITALPRTHIMKELAEYTTDEGEKDMLLKMATTTPEGKALYASWVQESCRHITHILEDLPKCKPKVVPTNQINITQEAITKNRGI